MSIFTVFFAILCCGWLISYLFFKRTKSTAFLDREQTDILKGYAILLVLWGHIGQYLGLNGVEFPAAVGVSLFLILSGYGIEKSFERYGLEKYWQKRLFRVWIPFAVCDTVALLIQHCQVAWQKIVLNYIFVQELYPFIWYFRFIFACYLVFWITGRLINNNKIRIITIFGISAIWFVLRSTIYVGETPFLEPRQMFCFPIGVVIASGGGYSSKEEYTSSVTYNILRRSCLWRNSFA